MIITGTNILTKEIFTIKTDSSPVIGDAITTVEFNGKSETLRIIATSRTLDRKKAIKLKDVNIKDYIDSGDITVQAVPIDVAETLMEVLQDVLSADTLEEFKDSQNVLRNYLAQIKLIDF
jgi:hypothetical protein